MGRSEADLEHSARFSGPITRAVMNHEYDPSMAHWLVWRTGRKVGRTIYAQLGELPSDDDRLIGVMDTPVMASEVVNAHNEALKTVQR